MSDLFKQDNPQDARLKKKKRKMSGQRKLNGYRMAVVILVFLNICAVVFAAYIYFNQRNDNDYLSPFESETSNRTGLNSDKPSDPSQIEEIGEQGNEPMTPDEAGKLRSPEVSSGNEIKDTINTISISKSISSPAQQKINKSPGEIIAPEERSAKTNKYEASLPGTIRYTVLARKAYFYNKPDERTRRDAFMNPWNKATLTPLDEQNGFIYTVYTNPWGRTSKGWLLKKDLKPLK